MVQEISIGPPSDMNHHLAKVVVSAIDQANALELLGLTTLVTERLRCLNLGALCAASETSGQPAVTAVKLKPYTQVYAAGCPGLFALSKRIGQPIIKIGTTTRADAMERIADLRWTEYGGYDLSQANTKVGFADYRKIEFQLASAGLQTGVRLDNGIFQVDLPMGWSGTDFEKAFRRVLLPYSVRKWTESVRGSIVLKRLGMVPADLRLNTKSGVRVCEATEFYLLSPARQGAEVLALITKAMSGGTTSCARTTGRS